MKILLFGLNALMLVAILYGCSAEKKAARKLAKEEKARLEEMAALEKIRDLFPVRITKYVPGDVTFVPGPVLPCPPNPVTGSVDSVRCPDSSTRTDTVYQEDTIRLQQYRDSLVQERYTRSLQEYADQKLITDLRADNSKMQERANKWDKVTRFASWVGALSFLALVIALFFKFRKSLGL